MNSTKGEGNFYKYVLKKLVTEEGWLIAESDTSLEKQYNN